MIYFKGSVHVIMGLAGLKRAGPASSLESRAGVDAAASKQSFFSRKSMSTLKAFSRLDAAHAHHRGCSISLKDK